MVAMSRGAEEDSVFAVRKGEDEQVVMTEEREANDETERNVFVGDGDGDGRVLSYCNDGRERVSKSSRLSAANDAGMELTAITVWRGCMCCM